MLNLKLKAPFQGQARAGPARKLAGLGSQAPAPRAPHTKSRLITCMAKPWRPSIDDVDSISWGGPAKVRGTGSRKIPHRLNAEERGLYDLAKKKVRRCTAWHSQQAVVPHKQELVTWLSRCCHTAPNCIWVRLVWGYLTDGAQQGSRLRRKRCLRAAAHT